MLSSRRRSFWCAVGALGIPLIALTLEMIFNGPFTDGVATIVSLMLGTACASNIFITPRLKIIAVIVYIPSILALMVFVGLWLACAKGGCV